MIGKKWIHIKQIYLCAVQEIRWPGKGTVIKKNYIFFIVDIKVTKMNLEQDFVLVDILWIIFRILNL